MKFLAQPTRLLLTVVSCAALSALLWPTSALAGPKTAKKPAPVPVVVPEPVVAPPPAPSPTVVEAPPVVAPGALILVVDADSDEVTVGGQAASVKKGDNRLSLPAGGVQYVVKFASGITVKGEAVVPAGGEVRAEAWSGGKLVLHVGDGSKVEIDGKAAMAAGGQVQADLPIGSHTLVVTQPGHIGRKATVDVAGGRTTEIFVNLDEFVVPVNNGLAWTGIIGGGVLIVTALVIDGVTTYDKVGGEATRWSLLGVGTAGFVGGTLLLKHNMDEVGTPPTQDGTFDVKITRYGDGAMALVGWRF